MLKAKYCQYLFTWPKIPIQSHHLWWPKLSYNLSKLESISETSGMRLDMVELYPLQEIPQFSFYFLHLIKPLWSLLKWLLIVRHPDDSLRAHLCNLSVYLPLPQEQFGRLIFRTSMTSELEYSCSEVFLHIHTYLCMYIVGTTGRW